MSKQPRAVAQDCGDFGSRDTERPNRFGERYDEIITKWTKGENDENATIRAFDELRRSDTTLLDRLLKAVVG